MDEEHVFKALADRNRRHMLDLLFQQDGLTLTELAAPFAEAMTRYGVMKHLKLLEDAGLVTTRKVGREKHHYLNPVPIQLAYDRWVSKYAQPWTQSMTDLKHALEDPHMSQKPSHVFNIYIKTSPERLWQALVDGKITPHYYFDTRVESDWQPGSDYGYYKPDGSQMIAGEVVEVDPPKKLVTTFKPLWEGDADMPVTTVTFEIEQDGDACLLTLTHDDLDPVAHQGVIKGWSWILSGLKTLLETGQPMASGEAVAEV